MRRYEYHCELDGQIYFGEFSLFNVFYKSRSYNRYEPPEIEFTADIYLHDVNHVSNFETGDYYKMEKVPDALEFKIIQDIRDSEEYNKALSNSSPEDF